MADNNNLTIFQRLSQVFRGTGKNSVSPDIITNSPYDNDANRILYTTKDRADYERKLNTLKQQKYLAYQWKKAGADNAMESLAGYTAVKLMYRDVDLMDGTPEIGTALDIISEETCTTDSKGKLLHVYSQSKRTKAILEDLFVNRLHIYTDLPMIARHMTKYGNTFMLLNIDKSEGIMGWTMLPVYEIDRLENGYGSAYSIGTGTGNRDIKPDEVSFVWNGHNEGTPYRNWQVAHFRLLYDSFFLPYGVSLLHKTRRAWRMWSMMEDAMLMWRLDKAVERRVYKIYVGNIDDADVDAYVESIANNFKRTQIIDPETGQVDLRKNFMDIGSDYFIPVRTENAPNPIETLTAANSQVQMEDVEYMRSKILTGIRVPKTFLNFQEAQGKGQNLAVMDVRFARMVNRIQQFLLMELNKIAMIHLYIMGMTDDIGNFTLSLNNSSPQIEAQELEDLTKRLTAMQTAVADPGNGIPMMSLHKALRDIMKMSDSEIKDMLQEIRMEKAMAAELMATPNIIKKTGMFDPVDRIYGDFDAMNNPNTPMTVQQNDDGGLGGGGGMGGLGGLGGDMDMDLGEPGTEGGSDIGGEMGETSMGNAPAADSGAPLMEAKSGKGRKNGRKQARIKAAKSFTEKYFEMLDESQKRAESSLSELVDFDGRNATVEKTISEVFNQIDGLVTKEELEREDAINSALSALSISDEAMSADSE